MREVTTPSAPPALPRARLSRNLPAEGDGGSARVPHGAGDPGKLTCRKEDEGDAEEEEQGDERDVAAQRGNPAGSKISLDGESPWGDNKGNLQQEEGDHKPCDQVDAEGAVELTLRLVCGGDTGAGQVKRGEREPETTVGREGCRQIRQKIRRKIGTRRSEHKRRR